MNTAIRWGTCALALGMSLASRPAGAVQETGVDRPVAGSMYRRVMVDVYDLHVYACSSEHRMLRRVWNPNRGWYAWEEIGAEFGCNGPPSVGKWESEYDPDVNILEQFEWTFTFWKDLNNRLIMAETLPNDDVVVTDMSAHLGVGPIAGAPVVVDSRNTSANPHRISVAVRKLSTNELFTLDHYSNSWHVRPMLTSGGAQATGIGSFVASYGQAYDKRYVSMQINLGAHVIFTRSSWSQSYQQYAFTASTPDKAPKGVLTFGGYNAPPGTVEGCLPSGCAIYRNPANNKIMWAPLSTGGNITSQFKEFAGPTVFSSVYASPSPGAWPMGVARAAGGTALAIDYYGRGHTDGWFDLLTLGTQKLASAALECLDAGGATFYAVEPNNRLYLLSRGANDIWGHESDMGIDVLAP